MRLHEQSFGDYVHALGRGVPGELGGVPDISAVHRLVLGAVPVRQRQAARTLVIFSLTVVALLLTAILVGGKLAMWCVVAVGCSPQSAGRTLSRSRWKARACYKSQVSSLLVMAILGGAILPPLQGPGWPM
jgi:fucose permease